MDHDVFHSDRPRLFSIAYRMLGSASDADDVLQDAWLRYSAADPSAVRSPIAFATTIVTRLCLDRLKSARVTREQYVGEWLPEPVLTSELEGPDTALQRAESVTLAFLVLLDTLPPIDRAVFLLKEVLGYDHPEISEILGVPAETSRQMLHRAKAKVAAGRRRVTGTPESRRTIAERFARALASGDANALTALLTSDAGVWIDGGGRKRVASLEPVIGREAVVDLLTTIRRNAARAGHHLRDVSLLIESVNFEPALVIRANGTIESVFILETDGEAISAIRVMRNPEKLARFDRRLSTASH